MGKQYTESLTGLPLQLPLEEPWARHAYWMYGVVVDEETGLDADTFAKRLGELGVQTRPFFLGMHKQPAFHKMGLFQGEHYPVAERLARQGLYLPSGMTLDKHQLESVCEAVRQVLKENM